MNNFNKWISPNNGKNLILQNDNFTDGVMVFETINQIPNLIYPKSLNDHDLEAKNFYEGRADDYDKYLHLTFQTYNEDEEQVRNKMIELLELQKDYKVLEVACGTGRDSVLIEKKLSSGAELHLTDISLDMISKAKQKLEDSNVKTYYSLSNAMYLPYPDNYFDAFYSFGAVEEFAVIRQLCTEGVRVWK